VNQNSKMSPEKNINEETLTSPGDCSFIFGSHSTISLSTLCSCAKQLTRISKGKCIDHGCQISIFFKKRIMILNYRFKSNLPIQTIFSLLPASQMKLLMVVLRIQVYYLLEVFSSRIPNYSHLSRGW